MPHFKDKYPGRLASLLEDISPCVLDEGAADLPYSQYRKAVQKNQDSLAQKLKKRGFKRPEEMPHWVKGKLGYGKRAYSRSERGSRHHLVIGRPDRDLLKRDMDFLRGWAKKLNASVQGDEINYTIRTPTPYFDTIVKGHAAVANEVGMVRPTRLHVIMPELPARRRR